MQAELELQIAKVIREVDGNNTLGSSALAERIATALLSRFVLCNAEPVAWLSMATSPPPIWFGEWFIAKLDNGDRVVLRWLPKENSYDFTTVDETYYKLYRVTHWMQFPDSQYLPLYAPADIGKEGGNG